MKRRSGCCCAILALACSRPDSASPAPTASVAAPAPSAAAAASASAKPADSPGRAAAVQYVTALEGAAKLFSAHAGQCDALAKALSSAQAERDALRASSSGEAHEHATTDPKLYARLEAATRSIADGSMSCSKNAAFAAANKRLLAVTDTATAPASSATPR